MKFELFVSVASVLATATSHGVFSNPNRPQFGELSTGEEPSLEELWGAAWPFQGINSFAHLQHHKCLIDTEKTYDVAVIGVPFDTATSYRPGARFGPRAIRAASQRQTSLRGFNQRAMYNPYDSWATVVDCDDIPVTPMDNSLAFKQMNKAFEELLFRRKSANNTKVPPKYVALGGDHSVLLPHLRALHKIYGPLNVIHFDAHLDTWKPDKYPSFWHSSQSELNHGSMLWKAYEEGLTTKTNIHAGLRTKLSGIEDYFDDDDQNFKRIYADEIWIKGVDYVIDTILQTISKDTPTYLSVDIDVLDPGFGSGTGTQEPGGWLPRELIYVLRALEELNIVGADVVEVSPAFDNAEITATNGAQVAYEIITSMVKRGDSKNSIINDKPSNLIDFVPKGTDMKDVFDAKMKEIEELKNKLLGDLNEVKRLRNQIRF